MLLKKNIDSAALARPDVSDSLGAPFLSCYALSIPPESVSSPKQPLPRAAQRQAARLRVDAQRQAGRTKTQAKTACRVQHEAAASAVGERPTSPLEQRSQGRERRQRHGGGGSGGGSGSIRQL